MQQMTSLSLPWTETDISEELDLIYHAQRSGGKEISPMVDAVLSRADLLSTSDVELLCKTAYAVYGLNWNKQWATMEAVYDPIQNYSMVEEMIDDVTEHAYDSAQAKTGKDTQTPDLTSTSSGDLYGFNSAEATPVNEQTDTATGTQTMDYDTSVAHSGTDTDTRNYELRRSGNIGVTTSQQMLQSERELWIWNFFRDVVFPDIDRIFTSPVW